MASLKGTHESLIKEVQGLSHVQQRVEALSEETNEYVKRLIQMMTEKNIN